MQQQQQRASSSSLTTDTATTDSKHGDTTAASASAATIAPAVTFRTALQLAVERHMAGSMHEAEFIYRQIIGQVSYYYCYTTLYTIVNRSV
jgi:hypothetical protein